MTLSPPDPAASDGWSDMPPDPEHYVALRTTCGLGARTVAAARIGMENGLHCSALRKDGAVIAMARIIGDGGCFTQLVDVMVHPDHRGQGHARAALDRALGWAEANLPESCLVSLVSTPGVEPVYAARGFRPLTGMVRNVGS
ncbi:GNAT family N-acetyltransferase [Roseobacter sp. HKCCA0434]|uniref:GNAT family N-acetyltransferase n=1 Tax=Roseobacter sp. HKCCA0434 TaxID=3079297 RepID=UPI002905C8D5|nr:GNAT family N-acetyltransferase [Roseobacter sp. HKCCA0434]